MLVFSYKFNFDLQFPFCTVSLYDMYVDLTCMLMHFYVNFMVAKFLACKTPYDNLSFVQ